MLVPRDPDDGKNVIVEIRGGEGGEEGNLWAADLYEMYRRYADLRRWKVETLASQLSDMGGMREVTFVVKGDDAWSRLKHEAGLPIYQPERESQVLGKVRQSASELAGPLTAEAVVRIFERVIDEARRAERVASERRENLEAGE